MVITLLFNQAYSNADIDRYYLGPVLWAWVWLAILGAEVAGFVAAVVGRFARPGATDQAVRSAAGVTAAIVAVVLLLPTITDLHARRLQADRSRDVGAQLWLDEALPVLEQDAVIVSWWSTSTPLWYAQRVEGRRPDVKIVDDRTMLDERLGRAPDVIRRFLGQRPVYAIRMAGGDLDELKHQFDMTRVAGDEASGTAVWKVNGYGVTIQ